MAFINFLKPKNQLEEGGRTAAPVHEDAGEPEKTCPNCHKSIPLSRLWAQNLVCACGHHFRMKARQRLSLICDRGSFVELFRGVKAGNPLDFPGYSEKIETARTGSGEEEAVICGTAALEGQNCCLFAMEPYFMMGSMGSAVGEKITRLFEYATDHRLPVIGFTVSGGARMQEGLLSLMQMAKTSAAVKRHSDAGCCMWRCSPTLPPGASPPASPWRRTSSWLNPAPRLALPVPGSSNRPPASPCPRDSRRRSLSWNMDL